MKFKNFEIRECVGINAENAKYEVVKWREKPFDGKPYCWVIAFICWNDREPCWQFDCVGMRFIDDYEDGLCEFIRKYMELVDIIRERGSDNEMQH